MLKKIALILTLTCTLIAIESDDELEQLKAQAKELLKRINEYEVKRNITETTTKTVVKKDTTMSAKAVFKPLDVNSSYLDDDVAGVDSPMNEKGLLELKNASTVLSVGGRVQLHSIYAWPQGSYFAGKIPINTTGEQGQLIMSARDSRFWVKTRTPSKYGTVRALIETDFLGTSGTEINTNSHGVRLRHAYIQVGGLTAGQTNSAFNDPFPLDTISYAVNDTFVRQPLIRYTVESTKIAYDLSFEQPETTLLDRSGEIVTPKDDKLPDIIARVRVYESWGDASVAFLNRYITQDSFSNIIKADSAYGWGLNISGKIKVFSVDDIRFNAQYGVGIGRYLAYDAYASGSIDADGNIDLQPAYGTHLGYRHWWSDSLRSTIGVSYAGTSNNLADIDSTDLAKVNRAVYGTQLNLLWIPIPNALLGVEYSKGVRYVQSDESGNMDLIILLLRYDF